MPWKHKALEVSFPARQREKFYNELFEELEKEGWELVQADQPTHNTAQGVAIERRMLFLKREVPKARVLTEKTTDLPFNALRQDEDIFVPLRNTGESVPSSETDKEPA